LSDVGGIGIKSGLNAAGAIRLTADAGTSETIILHADQGNGTGSICLTSDAGGITLNPATFVTVGANATNAAEMRMFEDTDNGCNYVALKAPNVSTSYTITLPTAVAGTCGFVLTSTTAGVTSWAAAAGGADLGTANTWTADQTFNDCIKVTLGTGGDADIYYNGTNLVIAPDVVGTGNVQIDATTSLNAAINQGVLNLNTTDAGSEGVWIVVNHDTASPADNDFPFGIYVFGPADDDSSHVLAAMLVKRCDVSACSSDSSWRFDVQYNSGAAANRSATITSAGVFTDHSAEKDKEFEGDATTVWGSRVIDKLSTLTVQRFHQPCLPASKTPIHHVSPTAEDLWEMFGVGNNPYTLNRDTTGNGVMDSPTPGIAPKDLAGLGLMAVQELTLEVNTIKTRLTAAGIA